MLSIIYHLSFSYFKDGWSNFDRDCSVVTSFNRDWQICIFIVIYTSFLYFLYHLSIIYYFSLGFAVYSELNMSILYFPGYWVWSSVSHVKLSLEATQLALIYFKHNTMLWKWTVLNGNCARAFYLRSFKSCEEKCGVWWAWDTHIRTRPHSPPSPSTQTATATHRDRKGVRLSMCVGWGGGKLRQGVIFSGPGVVMTKRGEISVGF